MGLDFRFNVRCLLLANMIEMWDVLRIMVPFSGALYNKDPRNLGCRRP